MVGMLRMDFYSLFSKVSSEVSILFYIWFRYIANLIEKKSRRHDILITTFFPSTILVVFATL